jgi:ribosome-associated toxin RatA of RatAB toxin-antitoxin module
LLAASIAAVPPGAEADSVARGNDESAAAESSRVALRETTPLGEVIVRVTPGPSGIEVEGRCRMETTRAMAWAVLTDYEGIARFVSSMRESRVTERGPDHVLVEQVAIGRLFLFSKKMRVVLRVREEPPGRIEFEDVLHRDFATYRGEWTVEQRGPDVEIVYRVLARPVFRMPDAVMKGVFRRTVRDLVSEVGVEIQRRDTLAAR